MNRSHRATRRSSIGWALTLFVSLAGAEQIGADDRDKELSQSLPGGQAPSVPTAGPAGAASTPAGPVDPAGPVEEVLAEARRHMARSSQLLAQRSTASATQQHQRASLEAIRGLIETLEQQGGGAKADGPPRPQEGDLPQGASPDRDPLPSEGDPDLAPAPDSSESVRRVWGQLPPQLRQRMRSAGVEEFLPQYEAMIEAYYKRLAEGPQIGP